MRYSRRSWTIENVSAPVPGSPLSHTSTWNPKPGAVDCRRAQNRGAVARDGHRRDSGALDGPGQNPVVLIGEVSARRRALAFAVRPNVPLPPVTVIQPPAVTLAPAVLGGTVQ